MEWLETLRNLLREGKVVETSLGVFFLRRYPEYLGRNPRTGQVIVVPEKRVPAFSPSQALIQEILGCEGSDEQDTEEDLEPRLSPVRIDVGDSYARIVETLKQDGSFDFSVGKLRVHGTPSGRGTFRFWVDEEFRDSLVGAKKDN